MENILLSQINPDELEDLIQNSVKKTIKSLKPDESFDKDEMLTRKDIKRLYKISYPSIHKMMQNGLPFIKMGRKTLFKRSSVSAFFSQKRGLTNAK